MAKTGIGGLGSKAVILKAGLEAETGNEAISKTSDEENIPTEFVCKAT